MTDKARANWSPGQAENLPTTEPLELGEYESAPLKNPHQAFIISMASRPGFSSFVNEVEYMMYEPDTLKNAEMEFIATKFPLDNPLLWFTLIVPLKDLNEVKKVAEKYRLTLKTDFVAISLDGTKAEKFPIAESPNVFFVQGAFEGEEADALRAHWDDVILKHAQGLPWKV